MVSCLLLCVFRIEFDSLEVHMVSLLNVALSLNWAVLTQKSTSSTVIALTASSRTQIEDV
jgi:hypothetical protein